MEVTLYGSKNTIILKKFFYDIKEMTNNYPAIVKELEEQVKNFREQAIKHRKKADEGQNKAEKYSKEALKLDSEGKKDEAQERHQDRKQFLKDRKTLIDRADYLEKLANEWEELAKNIKNECLEVRKDMDKLENYLKQGCSQKHCCEVRSLIKKYVLKEFNRYKILINICKI
ncbi:hypothetical protein JYQ62_00365 [Nostoc sp. UHCC 0702]|nr:hypothetical protein JYQ62_00365 [Nostoc sp. UHCC 0702]